MGRMTLTWAAVVAVGGVAVAAALRPSCEPRPPRRRPPGPGWAEVTALAAPSLPPGDPTLLAHALELLAQVPAVKDQVDQLDAADATGGLARQELPEPAQDAIDALMAWADERGGLPPGACLEAAPRALACFQLGKLALAVAAPDPDAPEVAAALYLGRRLRGDGSSLLEATVGLTIATRARAWAEAHSLRPGRAFAAERPTRAELVRALAAEAMCMDAALRHIDDLEPGARDELEPVGGLLGHLAPGAVLDHYIAEARAHQLELVRGAQRHVDDEPRLRAFFLEQSKESQRQRDNPVLGLLDAVPRQAARMLDEISGYDRFMAGGRP